MISSPVIWKPGFPVDSVKEWFWFLCKPRVVNIANFYSFWKHLIYIMLFLDWLSSFISPNVSHCHLVLGISILAAQWEYLGDLLFLSGLLWKILIQLTGMEPNTDNNDLGGTGLFCRLTAGCSLCLYFLPVLLIELMSLPPCFVLIPVSWELQTQEIIFHLRHTWTQEPPSTKTENAKEKTRWNQSKSMPWIAGT